MEGVFLHLLRFEPQSLWCLQTQMAVEPGNRAMAAGLLDFYEKVAKKKPYYLTHM